MWTMIQHVAGVDDPNSPYYLFWSGIGADMARIVASLIIVGPFAWLYHHHQCATDGCRKLAIHSHHCHCHRHHEQP